MSDTQVEKTNATSANTEATFVSNGQASAPAPSYATTASNNYNQLAYGQTLPTSNDYTQRSYSQTSAAPQTYGQTSSGYSDYTHLPYGQTSAIPNSYTQPPPTIRPYSAASAAPDEVQPSYNSYTYSSYDPVSYYNQSLPVSSTYTAGPNSAATQTIPPPSSMYQQPPTYMPPPSETCSAPQPTQDYSARFSQNFDKASGQDYDRSFSQGGNKSSVLGYSSLSGQDYNAPSSHNYNKLPDDKFDPPPRQDYNRSSIRDYNRQSSQDCMPHNRDYNGGPVGFDYATHSGHNYGRPPRSFPGGRQGPISQGHGSGDFGPPPMGSGFRNDERGMFQGGNGDRSGRNTGFGEAMQGTIFISGLPETVNEDELSEHFGSIGVIKKDRRTGNPKIWIYKDKVTGKGKGEATVTYEDAPAAVSAIDWFGGKDFQGKNITVQMAQRKSSAMGRPDGERGGRGGGRGGTGRGTGRFGGGPPGRGSVSGRDGDWKCPNPECGNRNFSWRSECNRCHSSKPEGECGDHPSERVPRGLERDEAGSRGGHDRGRGGRGSFGGRGRSGPIRRGPGGERDERRQRPY